MEMDRVYIVVFRDGAMQLFHSLQKEEHFKSAKCFSCHMNTSIDKVREFVYVHSCDTSKNLAFKEHF